MVSFESSPCKRVKVYDERPAPLYGDLKVLPDEIISHIFSFSSITSTRLVNRSFRLISKSFPLNCNFVKELGCEIISIENFKSILINNPNITSIRLPLHATNEYLYLISIFCEGIREIDATKCNEITDEGLKYLSKLKELENLNFSYCQHIDNEGLESLSELKKLVSLKFSYCKIHDAGLSSLLKLPKLKILHFSFCDTISNEGLTIISKLDVLEDLSLVSCPNITDLGLPELLKLPKLKILDLSRCEGITDEGLATVSKLVNLESLSLEICENVTDAGLPNLLNLRKLKYLKFSLYFITSLGTGFQQLASLEALEELDISSCLFPDDSLLTPFAKSRNLKSLNLSFCRIVTSDTIACLTHFTNLKHLNLDSSAYFDEAPEVFEQLKEMTWLESLVLSKNQCITDSIADTLSFLTNLKYLDISYLNVTDDLFPALKKLTSLESLDLEGCEGLTLKGLESLAPLTQNKLKNINTKNCFVNSTDEMGSS